MATRSTKIATKPNVMICFLCILLKQVLEHILIPGNFELFAIRRFCPFDRRIFDDSERLAFRPFAHDERASLRQGDGDGGLFDFHWGSEEIGLATIVAYTLEPCVSERIAHYPSPQRHDSTVCDDYAEVSYTSLLLFLRDRKS